MPAPRKRGNAQRRSFTTIFSNEQRYLSLTGLSRDIADASLGTQSNVFERCVTSSLLPSKAAERYAAMLYARDEPLSVLECIEALARELSITADEPASEEGLAGFVRHAYDYAARHRVEIGSCAARRALAADLEALVDQLSQWEAEGGPEAADRLLALISELSDDGEVALRDVPYAILSIWGSLGDRRPAFRTLADAAQAALAGDGMHVA
ncbi:MAG: hypothetical protein IJG82_00820, partial [Atopobiaceae bacterium]|nr:hypothetical protein [Atopobiaceae bacterium]